MVREEDCLNCDEESIINHLDFVVVDCTIHPVDNLLIKWKFKNIFSSKLDSSDFVNVLINLDSN